MKDSLLKVRSLICCICCLYGTFGNTLCALFGSPGGNVCRVFDLGFSSLVRTIRHLISGVFQDRSTNVPRLALDVTNGVIGCLQNRCSDKKSSAGVIGSLRTTRPPWRGLRVCGAEGLDLCQEYFHSKLLILVISWALTDQHHHLAEHCSCCCCCSCC